MRPISHGLLLPDPTRRVKPRRRKAGQAAALHITADSESTSRRPNYSHPLGVPSGWFFLSILIRLPRGGLKCCTKSQLCTRLDCRCRCFFHLTKSKASSTVAVISISSTNITLAAINDGCMEIESHYE